MSNPTRRARRAVVVTHSLALALATFVAAASSLPAQTFERSHRGDRLRGRFGASVDCRADFDLDGAADVVVGEPGADRVRIYSGRTGAVLRALSGAPDDWFGAVVRSLRDLDRDGWPDLLVTAPQYDRPNVTGYAIVFSGRTGGQIHRFDGTQDRGDFGHAANDASDTDGDGFTDILIASRATAYLFSGRHGGRIVSVSSPNRSVTNVAGAGDIDQDGRGEWLVAFRNQSSTSSAGLVVLFSGRDHRTLREFRPAAGDPNPESFGRSLAVVKSYNRDHFPDVLIGSPSTSSTTRGQVYVYDGLRYDRLDTLTGDRDGDDFGYAISNVGHQDHDDHEDFAVGARDPSGRGYVRTFRSAGSATTQSGRFVGDNFGYAVSGGGDIDGDGFGDIVIGAPHNDDVSTSSGTAYVYTGGTSIDPGRATVYGTPCPAEFGRLPRIALSGRRPRIGQSCHVRLRSAPFSSSGVLRISAGSRAYIPLDAIGMPDCALWTDPTAAVDLFIATFSSGTGGKLLNIPNDPRLVGQRWHCQFLVADPAANAIGVAMSDALELEVGSGS